MFTILSKHFPVFLGEKKVEMIWMTARSYDQTLPGGSLFHGRMKEESPGNFIPLLVRGKHDPYKEGVKLLTGALDATTEPLDIFEKENPGWTGMSNLDFLKSSVHTVGDTHYVVSFREAEATKAAYAAGYRTRKIMDTPFWEWSALGKVQEKS